MAARRLLRNLRLALWGAVLVAGLGATWLFMPPSARQQAQATDGAGQGDYRLMTSDGRPFTEASLQGRPSLVFFGFTHCPDICPMTMGEIMGWKEDLGPLGDELRVWFVTVDPARDTPQVLADYLSWFPGAIGVTGSPEELAKAMAAFGIFARKVPLAGGDYSMDHSAGVLLFDRDGRFRRAFGYRADPERTTAILRDVLGGRG